MAINLADDAVHALNRAAAVAARDGAEAITPRHVLAGTLSQRDPALLEVLAALDLALDALPEPMRDAPQVYGGHLPFTPPAHDVLAAAIEHASDASGPGVPTTSAHLLVGVAQAGDDETRGVLDGWGLDPEELADAAKACARQDVAAGEAADADPGENRARHEGADADRATAAVATARP